MANENTAKMNLHRHLQGYKGQTLSYENVKDMMSFVFDMAKDPNVTWVSQDSHIRLLNGIFKRIDQTVDDKSIAGIEESVCSAFVIQSPTKTVNSIGRPAALVRQADGAAALDPEPKDSTAGAASNESIYRRLHLDLFTFENKISKIVEASAQDGRDAAKRMMLERIELESRLAIERAELASIFSKERSEFRTHLDKDQDELKDLIKAHLKSQDESLNQVEQSFDMRMQALETATAAMKESIETLLKEHTQMQTANYKKTEGLIDTRVSSMEQKIHAIEEKASAGRKTFRRLNAAAVIGMIIMVAGFLAVIYFR